MLVFVAFCRVEGTTVVLPDSIQVLSALLPWVFFATSFSEANNSLIGNPHLVSKVRFPG